MTPDPAADETLRLRVQAIKYLGAYINAYELVDPDGGDLPPFTPGAHVDLYFRDGRVRQYSLCNDPAERHRYVIAVLRVADGRGGSKAIFDVVHIGRILALSRPRNHFPLIEDAARYLFIAGGIGITPIMSMLYRLRDIGSDFILHFCTRSPEVTTFRDELADWVADGRAIVHHDDGDPAKGLDIQALLETHEPGTQLYYSGPTGMMRAAVKASEHWPKGSVHFEYFAPPDEPRAVPSDIMAADDGDAIGVGFQIKLAKSGAIYDVPNDKSIVEVLRENGVEVRTSCEAGICRTCATTFLDGTPDHKDYILEDDEKENTILICCSRSETPTLVLDL